MKRNLTLAMSLCAALLATSACRSRTAADLPPEPPSATTPDGAGQDGGVAGAAVPGSRADFVQSVPADRVFFALDSYDLDAEDRATLDAQAAWLQRYPNVRVTIEGHADERGTREYNIALGDRRANAARDYLQSRGIDASRMQTISYGKERPAVVGNSEESYAQNRRAVTVVPE